MEVFKANVYLVLLLALNLSGCATPIDRLGKTLSEVRPTLKESQSFSFLYQKDEYYFAPDYFKQNGKECYLWLGFKNEKLNYAFSAKIFTAIQKIYEDNQDPEIIKKLLLEQIQNQKIEANKCFELGTKIPGVADYFSPDAGQGIGIVIWFFPVVLTFASVAFLEDELIKRNIRSITKPLRLSMSQAELPAFIKDKLEKHKKGSTEFFLYRRSPINLMLYFKDGFLDAWSQTYAGLNPIL